MDDDHQQRTTQDADRHHAGARGADTGSEWHLTYRGYDPVGEGVREALCTVANGYFGTRGAAPESTADGVHQPGTYIAGVYNRLTSDVADRSIENESLVNVPNWLPLRFRVEGGPWSSLDEVDVIDHEQVLDLGCGVLRRRTTFRDHAGRETTLTQRRLAHMEHHHLAALETEIRAENWSGALTVRSGIDADVRNAGVERYRDLADRHLEVLETSTVDEATILVHCRTTQSHIEIVEAARTRAWVGDLATPVQRQLLEAERAAVEFDVELQQGEACHVEKVVALFTSRDLAISEPRGAAVEALGDAGTFAELLESQVLVWDGLWRRFEIRVEGVERAALVLNLHVFHLLQVCSPNTMDLDVAAPARGLHGEAYRGHIFWDELFVFPLLTYRVPEIARELLRYRYRRLPAARRLARLEGLAGAMFPWQSGSSGREEAQQWHLNPRSGRWLRDETHRQRHINVAIAYNAWQYFQITDDVEFLTEAGGELLLEAARFWASTVVHDPVDDRYDIHGVVGPDEFHTDDPNWDGAGLRNNAYTNVMVAWLLTHAPRMLEPMPGMQRDALTERLQLRREELERWDDISRKLRVPFHDGVISQFQGYELLGELDWEAYRRRYGDIHRLDRILEAEGDDVNRYKASKQADALMLFYLLSYEELTAVLHRLGYRFDEALLRRTIDYYLPRTSHGSTLSRVAHSWVLARSDRRASLQLFNEALEADIADVQGGTTREGIHLGAMAATVDLAERGYSGMEVREGLIRFKPSLPEGLDRVAYRIYYQRRWITVELRNGTLTLRSEPTDLGPVRVAFHDTIEHLEPGGTLHFERSLDPDRR
jgi:trehalose/maltose hydrolase-like predicted phosphorylase